MKEGFWATKTDPKDRINPMPWDEIYTAWPEVSDESVSSEIITALDRAEHHATVKQYMGGSPCRLCDRIVGSKEFSLNGWIWPEGYKHYMLNHNVHPTANFVKFLQT